jgi:hypothetical protein
MKIKCISLILALTLISVPALVRADSLIGEPDPHGDALAMGWDAIVVRPLSYIALAGSAIIFLPAALWTAIGGNDIKPVQDALITRPANYAIKRPLGQFN